MFVISSSPIPSSGLVRLRRRRSRSLCCFGLSCAPFGAPCCTPGAPLLSPWCTSAARQVPHVNGHTGAVPAWQPCPCPCFCDPACLSLSLPLTLLLTLPALPLPLPLFCSQITVLCLCRL